MKKTKTKRPKSKLLKLRLNEDQWRLVGVALKHWGSGLQREACPNPLALRPIVDSAKYKKGRKMVLLALRVRRFCDKFRRDTNLAEYLAVRLPSK
jgi:hypothetical protein